MSEAAAPPRLHSLFGNREYRLLFIGQGVSMTGSWAYNVGLLVFVFDATRSPAWVAAASIARYMTAVVGSPIGGLIADRVNRVRLMVTLDLLSLLFQGSLALLALLHGPVIAAIGAAALTAATTSAFDPSARALVPAILPAEQLAVANSAQAMLENLSIVVGPAIAGVLLMFSPPAGVFALNATTFGISALILRSIRSPRQGLDVEAAAAGRPDRDTGVFGRMAEGVKAFAASPPLTLLAGFSVLASFVYGTDTVLLVVVSKVQLGTGANGYGYLLAALGVGGILVAGFMKYIAVARRLGGIIVVAMAVYCLPTALLAIVHSPIVAFGLEVIRGGATLVVDVLAMTALQRMIKPDVVARAIGMFFALVIVAISLGALLTPILLSAFGLTVTLVILGCAVPILSALTYPWIRALETGALRDQPDSQEYLEALASLGAFSGVSRDTLRHLAHAGSKEHTGAGIVLFRAGISDDDLFVLTAGKVDVVTLDKSHLIATREPLFCFGALTSGRTEELADIVTTVEPSTVFRIPGTDLANALRSASASHQALRRAKGGLAGGDLPRRGPQRVRSLRVTGQPRPTIDSGQSR